MTIEATAVDVIDVEAPAIDLDQTPGAQRRQIPLPWVVAGVAALIAVIAIVAPSLRPAPLPPDVAELTEACAVREAQFVAAATAVSAYAGYPVTARDEMVAEVGYQIVQDGKWPLLTPNNPPTLNRDEDAVGAAVVELAHRYLCPLGPALRTRAQIASDR